MRDEDARVGARQRVDADDRLCDKVFRHVSHEPVLPDDEHDVVGLEHEPRQLRPLDLGPAPVGRQRAEHFGARERQRSVALDERLD